MVVGAQGGSGSSSCAHTRHVGGLGGLVNGTFEVTPHETLYISVGKEGNWCFQSRTATFGVGAKRGSSWSSITADGGGASDIRRSENDLTSRIIVAGGGGGGGDGISGHGGGLIGGSGDAGCAASACGALYPPSPSADSSL